MVKVQVCGQVPELRCAAATAPVCSSLEILQVLPSPNTISLLSASPALPLLIFTFISSLTTRLVKRNKKRVVVKVEQEGRITASQT